MTRLNARLFEALVDSDTGAQNWGNSGEIALLGNACDVGSFCDAVLLECAVDSVSRQKRLRAKGLISLLAEITGQAGSV